MAGVKRSFVFVLLILATVLVVDFIFCAGSTYGFGGKSFGAKAGAELGKKPAGVPGCLI